MHTDARCADTVFYNGKVMTFEPDKKVVRAIAVSEGRIIAVGSDAEIRRSAPRGADKFDLGGKTVVPGFIDSHTHFLQMGVDALSVDLFNASSKAEALSLMKAAAGRTPEREWVIGTNYRDSNWTDGSFITRKDLDGCCPKHMAIAHRICGHLSSVNSKGIDAAGITKETPGAEVSSSGELSGVVTEAGVGVLRAATAPNRQKKMRGLRHALRKAHSLGVTSVQDNGAQGDFNVFREAEGKNKLKMRIWYNTPCASLDSLTSIGVTSGVGSEWLKLGGVKIFCDGALGARTAALGEPFADDPGNKGMFIHEKGDLEEMARVANDAGIQLVIHAIGDEGIEAALSSIERALGRNNRKDHRHRIEHLELPRQDHINRMRKHKVIASMQPNFVGEWSGIDGMYVERLGPDRACRNNPFKDILSAKVKLVFGSDCMPFSPLYGIRSAVNATYPCQRLTVEEAFLSYTREAAFASFEEGSKGSIAAGKVADFVVLSDDPFRDEKALNSVTVLKTILAGEVVFDRSVSKRTAK